VLLKTSRVSRPEEEEADLEGLVNIAEVILPAVVDWVVILEREFGFI